jgi:hypothetical protein
MEPASPPARGTSGSQFENLYLQAARIACKYGF